MKIWKRFAAALLAAGMVLVMLAACSSGGGGTPLSWETSRTKQYFESKGITGKEYTFKGTVEGVGEMDNVVYCVKDEQYYLKESYNDRTDEIIKDAQGDYYCKSSSDSAYDKDTGYKWANGSAEAKNVDLQYTCYVDFWQSTFDRGEIPGYQGTVSTDGTSDSSDTSGDSSGDGSSDVSDGSGDGSGDGSDGSDVSDGSSDDGSYDDGSSGDSYDDGSYDDSGDSEDYSDDSVDYGDGTE